MLHVSDLDAAVTEGIVTDVQASALRAFALKREKDRIAEHGHEERFRFMRGFNDFFFAVGILLFCSGLSYFTGRFALGMVIAAVIVWGLAELLVARMRLVLPGILLAIYFVMFVFYAVPMDLWLADVPHQVTRRIGDWFSFRMLGDSPPLTIAVKALVAAVAAALFYWRFKLPFALLLLAGSLVVAVLALTGLLAQDSDRVVFSSVILGCGLAVFTAAMAFDISDRERVTRRSDCAFWLHLLAAPLIVHSLISFVTPRTWEMSALAACIVVAIVQVMAVIAIAIDRRALLVSALSYFGIVIAYTIAHATGNGGTGVFFATVLILGAFVVSLGVGWMPLRRMLIGVLPLSLTRRLPLVPTHA